MLLSKLTGHKSYLVSLLALGAFMWIHAQSKDTLAAEIQTQTRTWNHIETVLMSAEYGGRSGVIERWTHSPLITTVGASGADLSFIKSLILNWNQLLAGTSIQLGYRENAQADIGVVFADRENFKEISAMYGFQIVEGGVGFAGTIANYHHQTKMGLVLIDDSLPERERKATIAQELYHTLGPINDSPYFPSSVLFKDTGQASSAIKLAEIDRKLLKFLYEHLKPGDLQPQLRTAFDKFWDKQE